MLREIPEYCEQFQCIADRCPDTCCRGWEVDIDPYTEEYYEEIPGEFGELLRDEMKVTDDGALFLPDQNGRCPFLNQCNLCEIILHLGEDAISQVCTEYPRYYHQIGDYEQVDMSLSCMELGRLFFSEEGPVRYALYEDDEPGDEIDDETYNRLMQLLDERSSLLETITELCTEHGTDYLKVRSILSEFPTSSLSLSDTRNALDPAQDPLLMKRLSETELLDHRWEEQFRNVQKYLADRESRLTQKFSQAADACPASELSASKFSDP
ncbi:MAG: flagellin lysine-N-methylase, partial [Lachnospiraceae bacterium]|nr:flagellin lysine-N-methylase [Lachnospiraceae bacterium]